MKGKTLFERMSSVAHGDWTPTAPPLKVLTVYQPWASLIIWLAKPYEFRGWNPRERGGAYAKLIGQRIVIHAAARRMVQREIDDILTKLCDNVPGTCLHREEAIDLMACLQDGSGQSYINEKFPLGCGLGTAVLGEPRNGYDIAEEFGLEHVNDSDRHHHANWGWPMLEVARWAEPIPMRGLQGFWNWPTPADVAL